MFLQNFISFYQFIRKLYNNSLWVQKLWSISEMTYTVTSGMLNSTIPYYTRNYGTPGYIYFLLNMKKWTCNLLFIV